MQDKYKVNLNAEQHKYYTQPYEVKSVTTILKRLAKPMLPAAAVKATVEYLQENNLDVKKDEKEIKGHYRKKWDNMANLGTLIHHGMEYMTYNRKAKNKLTNKGITEEIISYAQTHGIEIDEYMDRCIKICVPNAHKWMKGFNLEFVEIEKTVNYGDHFAGTADAVVASTLPNGNKVYYVLDYKTGSNVYVEHAMQIAAYIKALPQYNGSWAGGIIVHINRDTGEISSYYLKMSFINQAYAVFENFMQADMLIPALEEDLQTGIKAEKQRIKEEKESQSKKSEDASQHKNADKLKNNKK